MILPKNALHSSLNSCGLWKKNYEFFLASGMMYGFCPLVLCYATKREYDNMIYDITITEVYRNGYKLRKQLKEATALRRF
jgi:hypothetical protein